jgi:hypothetical protein
LRRDLDHGDHLLPLLAPRDPPKPLLHQQLGQQQLNGRRSKQPDSPDHLEIRPQIRPDAPRSAGNTPAGSAGGVLKDEPGISGDSPEASPEASHESPKASPIYRPLVILIDRNDLPEFYPIDTLRPRRRLVNHAEVLQMLESTLSDRFQVSHTS